MNPKYKLNCVAVNIKTITKLPLHATVFAFSIYENGKNCSLQKLKQLEMETNLTAFSFFPANVKIEIKIELRAIFCGIFF
jgi:hypothetical protein